MIQNLEQLAELVARRFASYLRAPLANASAFTLGGKPVIVKRKNGVVGTALGQINGLEMQGQTWAVTVFNNGTKNVRPWIFLRLTWTIGMAKQTADIDLPAGSVSLTLPFDCLEASVINDSPVGTDPAQEVDPIFQMAIATAWAGRPTSQARRTVQLVSPHLGQVTLIPAHATSVITTWGSAQPTDDLEFQFLDFNNGVIAVITLSASTPPIQQPAPFLIPAGAVAINAISSGNQSVTLIYTLSI